MVFQNFDPTRIPLNDTIPPKIRKSILVNQDLKQVKSVHDSQARDENVFRLDTKINRLIFTHIADSRKRLAYLSLDSQRQVCDRNRFYFWGYDLRYGSMIPKIFLYMIIGHFTIFS